MMTIKEDSVASCMLTTRYGNYYDRQHSTTEHTVVLLKDNQFRVNQFHRLNAFKSLCKQKKNENEIT